MRQDVYGAVANACALIPPEEDVGGWRWTLYQIADHAMLCQAALERAGLPVPGVMERPSSHGAAVGPDGRLRDEDGKLVEPVS